MSPFLDARVPVRFATADPAGQDVAWLIQGDVPAPSSAPTARFILPAARSGHPLNCACCMPRGPVAEALTRLFLARARGEVAFFRQVIALPEDAAGTAAIMAALATDPLVIARFRLEPAA